MIEQLGEEKALAWIQVFKKGLQFGNFFTITEADKSRAIFMWQAIQLLQVSKSKIYLDSI